MTTETAKLESAGLRVKRSRRLAALAVLAGYGLGANGQTIWTGHYDNFRTGANTNETRLTPDNVRPKVFGKLASLPVSGCVFAQPLLATGVGTTDGVTRNVVYIATSTNRVFAFDADNYTPIFDASFGTAPQATDFAINGDYHDFPDCEVGDGDGTIGIIGTPVIDLASSSMFFVANTVDGPDGAKQYHQILHRISLVTGADVVPAVEIRGFLNGVLFEPFYHLQRAALLLLNGHIYIPFASHQDSSPYHGWLFVYDTELNSWGLHNYSPVKSGAGIWQSGGGIASDGTSLFFTTGNLAEDVTTSEDLSDSILKVDTKTLAVNARASFPTEATKWDQNFDLDLGSSRAIVIPESGNVISGSKYGDAFLLRQGDMQVANRFQVAARHSDGFDWTGIYNGLAYWNGTIYAWPGGGGFVWGDDPAEPHWPTDTLKAFSVDPESLATTLVANGQSDGLGAGYQGANIVISANGNDAATGIVWAAVPEWNRKNLQPGSLHAYRASGFTDGVFEELWNNYDPEDPDLGAGFAKFNQPLVANGTVFLPTFSNKVLVYGLLPAALPPDPPTRPGPRIRMPQNQSRQKPASRSIIAR